MAYLHNSSSGLHYKSFMIVTYSHNDNGLYCKTMLLAEAKLTLSNLALARCINYDF